MCIPMCIMESPNHTEKILIDIELNHCLKNNMQIQYIKTKNQPTNPLLTVGMFLFLWPRSGPWTRTWNPLSYRLLKIKFSA